MIRILGSTFKIRTDQIGLKFISFRVGIQGSVLTLITRWVCFNDPASESLWVVGRGGVADTNYHPARWGWIQKFYKLLKGKESISFHWEKQHCPYSVHNFLFHNDGHFGPQNCWKFSLKKIIIRLIFQKHCKFLNVVISMVMKINIAI